MIDDSFFFFFSSRRRHTRCSRNWSSDVCSSDLSELSETVVRLQQELAEGRQREQALIESETRFRSLFESNVMGIVYFDSRSEERRVGKECRSRWSADH